MNEHFWLNGFLPRRITALPGKSFACQRESKAVDTELAFYTSPLEQLLSLLHRSLQFVNKF